jgi:hypothetical protein
MARLSLARRLFDILLSYPLATAVTPSRRVNLLLAFGHTALPNELINIRPRIDQ